MARKTKLDLLLEELGKREKNVMTKNQILEFLGWGSGTGRIWNIFRRKLLKHCVVKHSINNDYYFLKKGE